MIKANRFSFASAKPSFTGLIPEGTVIEGNLIISNVAVLVIQGFIKGSIKTGEPGAHPAAVTPNADVTLRGATVHGDIEVETLTIDAASHVIGNVKVKHLKLLNSGRITGDVSYETLSIERGCAINGKVSYGGEADERLAA